MFNRTCGDGCTPGAGQRRSVASRWVNRSQGLGVACGLIAAVSVACAGSGSDGGTAPSDLSSPPAAGTVPAPSSSGGVAASVPRAASDPAATAAEAPLGGDIPRAGAAEQDPTLAGVQGASDTTAPDAGSEASEGAADAPAPGSNAALAAECGLPATVSFRQDVQPFLIASCGGGSGCHVVDASSTMGSGGFNHAYDWATAGAHTSSCPDGPLRFEVLVAVSETANPPTCSKSRKMPPPDVTGAGQREPLTRCQIAALQAWLDEPPVTQMHRPDDSSPAGPYAMPPFN